MKDRLQGNPDAVVRAKEFVLFVKKNPNIATNEETMTCWFANAIMTGYDIEKKSLQEEQEAEKKVDERQKVYLDVRNLNDMGLGACGCGTTLHPDNNYCHRCGAEVVRIEA